MFERYTEHARRTIFFSRYSAASAGGTYIEPAHLLLGLIQADRDLLRACLGSVEAVDLFRERVLNSLPVRDQPLKHTVDVPLDEKAKQVLAQAAEEADQTVVAGRKITSAHLLCGLLREPSEASSALESVGITIADVRLGIAQTGPVRHNRVAENDERL